MRQSQNRDFCQIELFYSYTLILFIGIHESSMSVSKNHGFYL